MPSLTPPFFQDARLYQIAFLTSFLLIGLFTRDWTLQLSMVTVTIATCLTTQAIAIWLVARFQPAPGDFSLSNLFSPLITSLGLSILLRADHYSTMMLAAVLAIASKFLVRVQGKHLFNPANFGIIAALVLTTDAWVSPGQWGEEGWYAMLFLATGGLVLQRVGRWDTTIAFLGSYAGLEAGRNLWLGWTWDVWLHRLMSGSLLMFALFMITDPRTIPNARSARVVWAMAIALLTFILRNGFFLSTAVFWALFALAPLTIVLDRWLPDDRFVWVSKSEASRGATPSGDRVQPALSGVSTKLETG
jgi:Na+-transporting NADH:ubiquinone oxidoreductase subunit NqrB